MALLLPHIQTPVGGYPACKSLPVELGHQQPHVQANLEGALGWQLSPEDYDRISAIDFQLRLVDGIRFLSPKGPFR